MRGSAAHALQAKAVKKLELVQVARGPTPGGGVRGTSSTVAAQWRNLDFYLNLNAQRVANQWHRPVCATYCAFKNSQV